MTHKNTHTQEATIKDRISACPSIVNQSLTALRGSGVDLDGVGAVAYLPTLCSVCFRPPPFWHRLAIITDRRRYE